MGKFFVDSFSIRSFGRGFLENEQLVRLLRVFDQILSGNDTEQLLIRANIHCDDLIPLPGLRRQQVDLDFPMLDLLPSFCIKHLYFINIRHQNTIHALYIDTDASLKVLLSHTNLEIMSEFSGINTKVFLIRLEGDTIFDCGAKHHLGALHKVVHAILKLGHEVIWIDEVEENLLGSGYLNPFITFDKVDESSFFDSVIKTPRDFAGDLVLNLFEK